MEINRLLKNMIDQIKEAQIKLGYAKETIRLYYPVSSLNALLNTSYLDAVALRNALKEAEELQAACLGELQFTVHGERLEISIPPEGVEYVHQNVENPAFLTAIIELFQRNPHSSIEEICAVFASVHSDYMCEEMPEGSDFDYCIHFTDSGVDEYYYCIKMEMGHTIYHRFMKEDYEMLSMGLV